MIAKITKILLREGNKSHSRDILSSTDFSAVEQNVGRTVNDKLRSLVSVIVAMTFDQINERSATQNIINFTHDQFLQLTSVIFPTVCDLQAQHHQTHHPN